MSARTVAILRRTLSEVLLASYTVVLGGLMVTHHLWLHALAIAVGALLVAYALAELRRAGTLRMAWQLPHVDALGLPFPGDARRWEAAAAGERVLAALDGNARAYRDFFPGAARDVRLALEQALSPHAASEEVERVTTMLTTIGDQLSAVRPSRAAECPARALENLASRSHALATAVDELGPNVIPLRSGERS